MATATFISEKRPNQSGAVQRLYKLSEPIEWGACHECGSNPRTTEYIIASANNVPYSGPETYLFAADETGDIVDWAERTNSFKGGLDHEKALRNAGYEVVEKKDEVE